MPREDQIADDNWVDDIDWGVDGEDGIAAFLKKKPQEVYYLIKRARLPVKKHSHRIITASRRELRRHFTSSSES